MIHIKQIKVFIINGLLLTITSLFLKSINIFLGIYISNKIGSEAVGVYALIMSIYMFFITLSNSGINLATTRLISEAYAYKIQNEIHIILKKSIIYSLMTGLFSCATLILFSNLISKSCLHSKVSSIPLIIIAFSLPFIALNSCLNGYFTAIKKVKNTIYSQIIGQFVQIFLIIFLFNHYPLSSTEYICIILVIGITFSEIASFIVLFVLYYLEKSRESKNKLVAKFKSNKYLNQILKITIPISITSYIRSGLSTLKQILTPTSLEKSGISCEKSLSQYGIINGMVIPLILFPCLFISSFSMLLIPEFSYLNARKNCNKINLATQKILKISFIFSFLITGLFWNFSDVISNVIYKNSNIGEFIKILSPLIILMYIDNIVDSILKGLDKQVFVMIINIIDLFTSISCIYFIVPLYGIKGYILVLYISEFLNGIISLLLLTKSINLKINIANWIFKPLLCIFICNLLFKNITNSNILDLTIQILLYSFSYFILNIFLKNLIKNDFVIN